MPREHNGFPGVFVLYEFFEYNSIKQLTTVISCYTLLIEGGT